MSDAAQTPESIRAEAHRCLAEGAALTAEGAQLTAKGHMLLAEVEALPGLQQRLSIVEAATYLGVKERTLERWRIQKKGPQYVKIGTLVSYLRRDLDFYIESRRRSSTGEHRFIEDAGAGIPEAPAR